MISKKLAAGLGAGALGAAGAGTLGAKLFGKGGIKEPGTSFSTSTKADEMAVALAEKWESRSSGTGSVIIEIKEGSDVKWECTLKPILIGFSPGAGNIETLKQWKNKENEVKNDPNKREKFVENCSGSRVSGERENGIFSTIELESTKDKNVWKFKNLEKLWTEDYRGLARLDGEDLKAYLRAKEENGTSAWSVSEESKAGKVGKIKISVTPSGETSEWLCHISGTADNNLDSNAFKEDELKGILNASSQDPNISEKKKYLIRNCVKHGKNIEGLKIKIDASNSKWEFDEQSIKKITEGMYENPNAN